MQNARNYAKSPVLTATKLRPYATTWKLWWKVLQPAWRGADEWPFRRNVAAEGKDWGVLLRGGNNGLYLIIVSLGWWLLAASKASEERPGEWEEVVNVIADVDWVFERLLMQARSSSQLHSSSPKRAADVELDKATSKRSRTT